MIDNDSPLKGAFLYTVPESIALEWIKDPFRCTKISKFERWPHSKEATLQVLFGQPRTVGDMTGFYIPLFSSRPDILSDIVAQEDRAEVLLSIERKVDIQHTPTPVYYDLYQKIRNKLGSHESKHYSKPRTCECIRHHGITAWKQLVGDVWLSQNPGLTLSDAKNELFQGLDHANPECHALLKYYTTSSTPIGVALEEMEADAGVTMHALKRYVEDGSEFDATEFLKYRISRGFLLDDDGVSLLKYIPEHHFKSLLGAVEIYNLVSQLIPAAKSGNNLADNISSKVQQQLSFVERNTILDSPVETNPKAIEPFLLSGIDELLALPLGELASFCLPDDVQPVATLGKAEMLFVIQEYKRLESASTSLTASYYIDHVLSRFSVDVEALHELQAKGGDGLLMKCRHFSFDPHYEMLEFLRGVDSNEVKESYPNPLGVALVISGNQGLQSEYLDELKKQTWKYFARHSNNGLCSRHLITWLHDFSDPIEQMLGLADAVLADETIPPDEAISNISFAAAFTSDYCEIEAFLRFYEAAFDRGNPRSTRAQQLLQCFVNYPGGFYSDVLSYYQPLLTEDNFLDHLAQMLPLLGKEFLRRFHHSYWGLIEYCHVHWPDKLTWAAKNSGEFMQSLQSVWEIFDLRSYYITPSYARYHELLILGLVPLAGSADFAAANPNIQKYLQDSFKNYVDSAWQVFFELFPDWEGSLPDLVASVQAVAE